MVRARVKGLIINHVMDAAVHMIARMVVEIIYNLKS